LSTTFLKKFYLKKGTQKERTVFFCSGSKNWRILSVLPTVVDIFRNQSQCGVLPLAL